ncbi:MAG: hypothetical protein R3B38_01840 [Patescibacteria group bacterium]
MKFNFFANIRGPSLGVLLTLTVFAMIAFSAAGTAADCVDLDNSSFITSMANDIGPPALSGIDTLKLDSNQGNSNLTSVDTGRFNFAADIGPPDKFTSMIPSAATKHSLINAATRAGYQIQNNIATCGQAGNSDRSAR